MSLIKRVKFLDSISDKDYSVEYTPQGTEDYGDGTASTICASSVFNLKFKDENGGEINAAPITITSYSTLMAEIMYSAWLGWKEEIKQNVPKPTLNIDDYYIDSLYEYGSYTEAEVKDDDLVRALGYKFQFIEGVAFVRNNEDVPNTSDNNTWMVERVPYFHERIYTEGGEIPDQITQTVALPEEIWWKCHLGLISIHDNWDELYEKYSLSEENKESLIDEFIKLNS